MWHTMHWVGAGGVRLFPANNEPPFAHIPGPHRVVIHCASARSRTRTQSIGDIHDT